MKELLDPALVELNLTAPDWRGAVATLTDRLVTAGYVSDATAYQAAVCAREELGSTAVGLGVAIPHGKSEGVARAAVAFGRPTSPIDWQGEQVELIFLLAAPEGGHDEHLKALGVLARRIMHEEVREGLSRATSASEVISLLLA